MIKLNIIKNEITKTYLITETIKHIFPNLLFFKMIEFNEKYNISNNTDEENIVIDFIDDDLDQDIFDLFVYPLLINNYNINNDINYDITDNITFNNIEAVNDVLVYLQLNPIFVTPNIIHLYGDITRHINLLDLIKKKLESDCARIKLYNEMKLFIESYTNTKLESICMEKDKEKNIFKNIIKSIKLAKNIELNIKNSFSICSKIKNNVNGTYYKFTPIIDSQGEKYICFSKCTNDNSNDNSNNYPQEFKLKYVTVAKELFGENDYRRKYHVNIYFFDQEYKFVLNNHLNKTNSPEYFYNLYLEETIELKQQYIIKFLNSLMSYYFNKHCCDINDNLQFYKSKIIFIADHHLCTIFK